MTINNDAVSGSTIKEKNAAFSRLKKSEKKIAIAKEVLLQLDTEKLEANFCSYVIINNGNFFDFCTIEAIQKADRCQVCALGGLFVAAAKLNRSRTKKYINSSFSRQAQYQDFLEDVFSYRELTSIENAFEDAWYKKYPNSDKCLRAIMGNIIRNGGSFLIDDV